MVVNGFQLPAAFVELCEAIRRGEMPDQWALKERVDAYGIPWENFELLIYTDPETIAAETEDMEWRFREDDRLQQYEEYRDQPGFIQDFTGVSNYVRFGKSNTGECYCFDFGGDPREPSVVTWPDVDCYWRRVAPNFQEFMALFIDAREAPRFYPGEIPPLQPGDEGWDEAWPSPGDILVSHVRDYVQEQNESCRVLFLELEDAYAESSAGDRRAAEAQVRSELEAQGMTDEQRLWTGGERTVGGVVVESAEAPTVDDSFCSEP